MLNEQEASREASIAQHPRRIPGFNPSFRLLARSHVLTLLFPPITATQYKGGGLLIVLAMLLSASNVQPIAGLDFSFSRSSPVSWSRLARR